MAFKSLFNLYKTLAMMGFPSIVSRRFKFGFLVLIKGVHDEL